MTPTEMKELIEELREENFKLSKGVIHVRDDYQGRIRVLERKIKRLDRDLQRSCLEAPRQAP